MRLARLSALATLCLAAALCAALLGGCGGSGGGGTGGTTAGEGAVSSPPGASEEPTPQGPPGAAVRQCGKSGLEASGTSCAGARAVLAGWRSAPGCAVVGGGSHASCRVRGYLCIAAAVGRGTAVSCALPERSIVFLEPRG